jgi:O-antigen/teichoic acid export membrane protein
MRAIAGVDRVAYDNGTRAPLARIASMGVAFAASNVARGAIALATSLVVARGLGQDAFGQWVFCAAWASTLTTMLDLGFGVLLTRDAARDRRVCGLLSRALLARLGLFLPVALGFYLAAPRLGSSIGLATGLRAAVPLALTGIAYGCLAALFRAWPDRLLWILSLESASALAQCGASWWLIRRGGGVVELLWLASILQLGQLVVAAVLLSSIRLANDRMEWPSRSSMMATLRRATPFAAVGLIGTAQGRLAPLALGYLKGADAVALFAVAWRMGNAARALPSAAFAGALPVLSERAAHGEMQTVRPLFHRGLQAFAFAAAILLALFAAPLIRWTYGSAFSGAGPALVCVAAGLVPSLLNSGRRVYLFADQREGVAMRWSAVALAVQLAGCAILIPRLGALGAAMALTLGECAVWWPLSRA